MEADDRRDRAHHVASRGELNTGRSASSDRVAIREFKSGDEACFRKLNEEWITRYFRIEAKDEEALEDPRSSILAPGGRIFFAQSTSSASAAAPSFVPPPMSSRWQRWQSRRIARVAGLGANCCTP